MGRRHHNHQYHLRSLYWHYWHHLKSKGQSKYWWILLPLTTIRHVWRKWSESILVSASKRPTLILFCYACQSFLIRPKFQRFFNARTTCFGNSIRTYVRLRACEKRRSPGRRQKDQKAEPSTYYVLRKSLKSRILIQTGNENTSIEKSVT